MLSASVCCLDILINYLILSFQYTQGFMLDSCCGLCLIYDLITLFVVQALVSVQTNCEYMCYSGVVMSFYTNYCNVLYFKAYEK